MKPVKKPPLGLVPKHVSKYNRQLEILEAMKRYSSAKINIPLLWIEELEELLMER